MPVPIQDFLNLQVYIIPPPKVFYNDTKVAVNVKPLYKFRERKLFRGREAGE